MSGEAEPKVGARVKITSGDLIGEKGRYIGRTSYDPDRLYDIVLDDGTKMSVDRFYFRIILTSPPWLQRRN
jgi:hypothetical protein